jgi:hypothetical protein
MIPYGAGVFLSAHRVGLVSRHAGKNCDRSRALRECRGFPALCADGRKGPHRSTRAERPDNILGACLRMPWCWAWPTSGLMLPRLANATARLVWGPGYGYGHPCRRTPSATTRQCMNSMGSTSHRRPLPVRAQCFSCGSGGGFGGGAPVVVRGAKTKRASHTCGALFEYSLFITTAVKDL